MTDPGAIEIRPARPGELSAAARVYLLTEDDELARRAGETPRAGTPEGDEIEGGAQGDLRIAAADHPEGVLVAIAGSEVIGVAAWRLWEQWWFLGYLFVLPDYQGRSIGRALLERAHAIGVAAGCTHFSLFASRDPRALWRYLTLGLRPQPPVIDLLAAPAAFRPSPTPRDDGLLAQPLGPEALDP